MTIAFGFHPYSLMVGVQYTPKAVPPDDSGGFTSRPASRLLGFYLGPFAMLFFF